MVKNIKRNYIKLDNAAKAFSLEDKNNTNTFRFSVILKENIDEHILKQALNRALNYYSIFKVKFGTSLFWNYYEFNSKEPIIKKEKGISCAHFNLKKNNDYLFKVTYYNKKINLDVLHALTDGTGAIKFFKCIIYSYLDIKYNICFFKINNEEINYQDQYLKVYEKNVKTKEKTGFKEAYLLPGKMDRNINSTYHYIIDVDKIKKVCKKYNVTITEYLTAVYAYAIYLELYNKKLKKEIVITVPINLRKYYPVDTLANFFVCMDVNPKIIEKNINAFDEILKGVHIEFKEKLTKEKIKAYLARDVNLGMNVMIRVVPLFLKKLFMKYICPLVCKASTSTVSNVGIIDIDDNYKKYIDNIFVLVMPGRTQKVKCTICSFNNKLNVIINSNIESKKFISTFSKLLQKDIDNIKLESNNTI